MNSGQIEEHANSVKDLRLTGTSYDKHLSQADRLRYNERRGVGTLMTEQLSKNKIKHKMNQKNPEKYTDINIIQLSPTRRLMIISAYLPTNSRKRESNEKFEEAVNEILSAIEANKTRNTRIIVLGDLNFCPWGHAQDKKRVRLVQRLITCMKGCYIVPREPTHKSKSKESSWSHLDGAIITEGIHVEEVKIIIPRGSERPLSGEIHNHN